MITNEQIAKAFDNYASLLEFLDRGDPADPFRVRTYRKIANIVRNYDKNIYELWKEGKLEKIPGFGKETWAKLLEFLETWKISSYERLKEDIPESVLELMNISWVGPKLAKHLYQDLWVKSPQELEDLIQKQPEKILSLPRMWEKSLEKIKQWLDMYRFTKTRTPLGFVYPYAKELLDYIKSFPEVKQADIAGSLRRMKETIWDIDILCESNNPIETMEKFSNFENVERVLVSWPTKTSVFLKQPHIQVDLRIVPKESYGSALQYFTGSKQHNIHLRTIAKEKWYKISEYGIFKLSSENHQNKSSEISIKVWWEKEIDIYHTLGMDMPAPEMRQDLWEIELAQAHKLPKLIEYNDLKWDLHTHSTWSDGQNTIEEMVKAAIDLGYEYIAITDHSPSLAVANWLDKNRFFQKLEEIRQLRQKYRQIKILMWTEVDILPDGSLDYDDEVLKECQIVIASIHRWYSGDQTERYLKVLDNPYITAIGHPSWRIFGERPMMEVDWLKVFKKAIKKWVLMEINSQPLRLDLPDFLIRQFSKMWWKFLINTDAHAVKCLQNYYIYGIGQARRAWLEAKQVLNTYSWEDFSKNLNIKL
jgi:DNA polymerase (family 10)